ncbi:MAG: NAD-dependent epimerase/dehydratase family protein [Planctomycetales bacterium]|nr:NAD-dependent epimerase/dehydratase family protein [Planctomycetales bacterium]
MFQASPAAESWLIVGCGYVGQEVARLGLEAGHTVYALTRSTVRFAELQQLGIQPLVGHWLQRQDLDSLPPVTRILIAVPHREDGGLGEQTHRRGLSQLLAALPDGWSKLVYLSSTGVYGQDSQRPVDEDTPVCPTRLGPRIAVAAEQWLEEHWAAEKYTVLRLAGIYGPGRIPLLDKLRHGEPLAVPRSGYLNLVHRTDIARMLLPVLSQALPRSVYVFSDGQPVLRETFYRYLAALAGVAQPSFAPPDAHSPRARRATDKRIDPSRLVRQTNFEFRFPDYRSGLEAALKS